MKFDFIEQLIFPPRCMLCGEILPIGESCEVCRERAKVFKTHTLHINVSELKKLDSCIAFYYYDDIIRDSLIHAKYKSCDGFKREFLSYTDFDFGKFFRENEIDTLISMPFYKKKMQDNEYDLPREMARLIAKKANVEYNRDLVKKVKYTPNQHILSRTERKTNLKDAFALNGDVKGKSVAVVDDIVTTGYSMEEVAGTLKRGGAAKVIGIAFAYNMK